MVIEEDKVIELEDKSRHLLIKKIRYEGTPYMICLRLTDGLLFELFRFGEDAVTLETDPAVISEVLDSYVSSKEYEEEMEKLDAAIAEFPIDFDDDGDSDDSDSGDEE